MKLKPLVLALVLTLALGVRLQAILGVGDIVFDPSVYAQALQQVIRLEQQYVQLVQSYQTLRSQYQQMVENARRIPVDMSRRYRVLQTPWSVRSASDAYGTTRRWTSAATTGREVSDGFRAATEPLHDYGSSISALDADQQRYVKSSYGTVELTDAATESSLETVGRLRANATAFQAALQRLEDDSLSGDPALNSEVGVLNKINAATIVALHSAQDTNALLVALTEQQAISAKRTRDAEARSINQHIRFVGEAKRILTAQTAGASDAMRRWRMP